MIWHDLRTKPKEYEYLLVETKTEHYPFRVCIYFENDLGGYYRDAYKTSYFHTKKYLNGRKNENDFVVKRWAYIDDLLNLDKK